MEMMFECYRPPKIGFANDAISSLKYFQHTHNSSKKDWSGVIVSFGNKTTHLLPILNNQLLFSKVKRINIGGNHCSDYMCKLLQGKYPGHKVALYFHVCEAFKERYGFIATDYVSELLEYKKQPLLTQESPLFYPFFPKAHVIQLPVPSHLLATAAKQAQQRVQLETKPVTAQDEKDARIKKRIDELASQKTAISEQKLKRKTVQTTKGRATSKTRKLKVIAQLEEMDEHQFMEMAEMHEDGIPPDTDVMQDKLAMPKDPLSDQEDQMISLIDAQISKLKSGEGLDDANVYTSQMEQVLYTPNTHGPLSIEQEFQVVLGVEKFRANEILFQPSLIAHDQMGVSEALYHVIKSVPGEEEALRQNIFLAGGPALTRNMAERVRYDLKGMFPENSVFNIQTVSSANDAWRGLSRMALIDDPKVWITKKDYEEYGKEYFSSKFDEKHLNDRWLNASLK